MGLALLRGGLLFSLFSTATATATAAAEAAAAVATGENDSALTTHRAANVPGRAPSEHYAAFVRAFGSGDEGWQPLYVYASTAKNATDYPSGCGYFSHLNQWTASWVSIEAGDGGPGIEVKVQRLGAAKVHGVG